MPSRWMRYRTGKRTTTRSCVSVRRRPVSLIKPRRIIRVLDSSDDWQEIDVIKEMIRQPINWIDY